MAMRWIIAQCELMSSLCRKAYRICANARRGMVDIILRTNARMLSRSLSDKISLRTSHNSICSSCPRVSSNPEPAPQDSVSSSGAIISSNSRIISSRLIMSIRSLSSSNAFHSSSSSGSNSPSSSSESSSSLISSPMGEPWVGEDMWYNGGVSSTSSPSSHTGSSTSMDVPSAASFASFALAVRRRGGDIDLDRRRGLPCW
ncbi:hypothetical protein B0H16DRAFT_1585665 [Mycena metata]|uniref:Uncharacterized protein n=1 Tax=Mycena metata TaxID=1033252 RepID=A0AAD7MRQ7_9AGAR|nr:hypothetical protein B0H16DRAFT_1585665 [Mycena metata]